MKALVTGGAGNIGCDVVDQLVARGAPHIALVDGRRSTVDWPIDQPPMTR